MCEASNIAKWFMKKGLDSVPNTFDGNMKLQKLLFFANCISLAKNGKPLFTDPILAFENGCVIESIRQRYKNDYATFKSDSEKYNPDFSKEEYDVLNLTADIFGDLSAKELSELNHSFDFWKKAFDRSKGPDGYKCKEKSIISQDDIMPELPKIQQVLAAHKENTAKGMRFESVNGIKFYYSPAFDLNDDIISRLDEFSRTADEKAYTVYQENGDLVIY